MSIPKNAGGAWTLLAAVPRDTLTDARLQLHWAAQVAASVGVTHLAPRPDDSHPNLEWVRGRDLLAGHFMETGDVFRVGLAPATLTLHLLDVDDRTAFAWELAGRTLDQAYDAAAEAITDFTRGERTTRLTRPPYDLPTHDVASGSPFSTPGLGLEMLSRWYANADAVLREVQPQNPGASSVRCWPHHFDIATLITLDPGEDPRKARSVGVGMTPGDGSYADPYWYVNPWPRPESLESLPALGAGHWHTEGWAGAVLTAADVLAAEDQLSTVAVYLDSALAACRQMLGS